MAIQEIGDVEICGSAACVPSKIEENEHLDLFQNFGQYEKFALHTGVERRRVASEGQTASDLCLEAAEKLLIELGWEKEDVDCLLFISHSPDYRYPATACILQGKLGLSQECMSFDISLGCSGWVYGLTVAGSLVTSGKFKKTLLLTGDVTTSSKSKKDRTTYPLFGDAGSATALRYKKGAPGFCAHLGTDGENFKAIMVEDGGGRNRVTEDSLIVTEADPGIFRNRLQTRMDGMTP